MKNTHRWVGLVFVLLFGLVLTACNANSSSAGNFATVPAGMAYAEGKEIYFSHTEASDPTISEKLSNMMKSPVLLVPSLAKVPDEATAVVYVFENGVSGKGPLGFQPDVFDNPPGTSGYSPLRKISVVTWTDSGKARVLKSSAEVLKTEADGLISMKATGVVVNMPFMVWDGGKR